MEKSSSSTHVHGNVEKLTQVGHLVGNVFVTDSKTVEKFIEDSEERQKFVDSTPQITVTLVSERFGRRVRLTVPQDITAGALAFSIVQMLKLPKNHRVTDLGFELVFSYSITFNGKKVERSTKLSEAGVRNDSEIGMLIYFEWKDGARKYSGGGGSFDKPSHLRYIYTP